MQTETQMTLQEQFSVCDIVQTGEIAKINLYFTYLHKFIRDVELTTEADCRADWQSMDPHEGQTRRSKAVGVWTEVT